MTAPLISLNQNVGQLLGPQLRQVFSHILFGIVLYQYHDQADLYMEVMVYVPFDSNTSIADWSPENLMINKSSLRS